MIFSLEALNAKHGDALLLHYGTAAQPRLAIIDGGPSGVWKTLSARLDELRAARTTNGEGLPVALMMLSHIDDDHIHGLLDCTADLVEQDDAGEALQLKVARLWHNSFADIANPGAAAGLAGVAAAAAAAAGGTVPAGIFGSREAAAIVASVAQGKRLRDNARKLGTPLNVGSGALIHSGIGVQELGGLKLTVIAPLKPRLEALQQEWQRTAAQASTASAEAAQAIIAAYVDKSVYNLSSIVVLATHGTHTMLLTGDARGDDIIAGLEAAKLLNGGALHVDLLKLPHHGSSRDVVQDFFCTVTADHYVISADGKYGNPDVDTLEMLLAARGKASYTIHLTNHVKKADAFLAAHKGKNVTVEYRGAKAKSLVVDLDQPLP